MGPHLLREKLHGRLELPASADFHVHLRDGAVMRAVVPTIRRGGVNVVYVMPNLDPPITTVQQAIAYQFRLLELEPHVTFLMTLYLHRSTTPETIREAKRAGITGVKSYPMGVTTNSGEGVVDYEPYYPVFEEMQRQDLVLNLHGELPSSPGAPSTILDAEERFLPTLQTLHRRFPSLRIVLEHVSSAAGVAAVRGCGPTVAGTITPHHLTLTIDDWAADPFAYCKPVAKLPSDRAALLAAAAAGDGKFFLGSDSAPHLETAKRGGRKTAAGVFSQPYVTQLVLDALEAAIERGELALADVEVDKLAVFLAKAGCAFYRQPDEGRGESVVLGWEGETVVEGIGVGGENDEERGRLVTFRAGQKTWSLLGWKKSHHV
ncbi:MAG: hypothetical protein M1832_002582 [Thelocarpon impressellum]|nr:MAG: hypothetical protein M1832_002582 [Thelocarpon impressellum]